MNEGAFQLILGPNVGALAAGRNLGRFANILGPEARYLLDCAAREEARQAPWKLRTELVYLPRRLRSANVVIRPVVRDYEIVLGTVPGEDAHQIIALDELVIGVRNHRFYVKWQKENQELLNIAELVVSLVQRAQSTYTQQVQISPAEEHSPLQSKFLPLTSTAERLKPPGSEWLFVKLYCESVVAEEMLAYPVRSIAEESLSRGLAREYFFLRYHLRTREGLHASSTSAPYKM